MRLLDVAHARSGDKGDIADITVIAYRPDDYPLLCAELTAARVARFFSDTAFGDVDRYELPHLSALKFVLHRALGGGVTRSTRLDPHGKALASCLLALELVAPTRSWRVV